MIRVHHWESNAYAEPRPQSSADQTQAGAAGALRRLADDESIQRVTVAQLLGAVGESAPAVLVLLLAAPNVVPMPPGTSAILGAPLVLLALQLATGPRARLPSIILRRSIPKAPLVLAMRRVATWLTPGTGAPPQPDSRLPPRVVRLTGAVCTLLALLVLLPIPFGNIPPALAICLCCIGILRGDRRWIMAGWTIGIGALVLVSGVLYGVGTFIGHRL
jgi:hypothetical protein